MQLEVLRTYCRGEPRPVDILLVHGSFGGAWVWERYFMPYFAAAGFNVHALSLRGHAGSPAPAELQHLTLADYTADLMQVTATLERPTVVIGHSLGGAVVQSAITSGARFAGTVLMASVPPYGMLPANIAMFWARPALWQELAKILVTGVRFADAEILRHGLFANRIGVAAFDDFTARVGDESPLAIIELLGLHNFAPLPWQAHPILVMGGTRDWFIGLPDLYLTAAWYGTRPVALPGLSHAIMLDPDWRTAADIALAWITQIAPAGN